eukprot:scaffold990_cov279-Pinguiococcus_pyrenoidosus.AAC.5
MTCAVQSCLDASLSATWISPCAWPETQNFVDSRSELLDAVVNFWRLCSALPQDSAKLWDKRLGLPRLALLGLQLALTPL